MTTKSTSLRIAQNVKREHESGQKNARSRYIYTKGGFVICSRCACFNQRKFALDDLWEVVNDPTNKKDAFLICDNCGDRIKPAISSNQ